MHLTTSKHSIFFEEIFNGYTQYAPKNLKYVFKKPQTSLIKDFLYLFFLLPVTEIPYFR